MHTLPFSIGAVKGGWRFGVRRTRPFTMLESEFDALTQAGAAGAAADRTTGRSG